MSFAIRVVRPFAPRLLSTRQPISPRPRVIPSSCGFSRSFSRSSLWHQKKYTESHEWVEVADNGIAKIGITEYAAKSLGDVIYVELPTADSEVSAGDPVGAVESVKSASDVLAPISVRVIEGNTALEDKAKLINESPEDAGWIAKVKVLDATELENLMDVEAYKQSVRED
jgi:glycine cleavage system H protein